MAKKVFEDLAKYAEMLQNGKWNPEDLINEDKTSVCVSPYFWRIKKK